MNFYAYREPLAELGQEKVGSDGKILSKGEYRTIRGFIRHRIPASWRESGYRVYTFTNFYDDHTFTLIARVDASPNMAIVS